MLLITIIICIGIGLIVYILFHKKYYLYYKQNFSKKKRKKKKSLQQLGRCSRVIEPQEMRQVGSAFSPFSESENGSRVWAVSGFMTIEPLGNSRNFSSDGFHTEVKCFCTYVHCLSLTLLTKRANVIVWSPLCINYFHDEISKTDYLWQHHLFPYRIVSLIK